MDILQHLPPASQNNSREIVRRLLDKFNKQPSESLAQKIESMSGLSCDWSDRDHDFMQRGQK